MLLPKQEKFDPETYDMDFGLYYRTRKIPDLPQESFLQEGEKPVVYKCEDLELSYQYYSSNWWLCIGYSSFEWGVDQPMGNVAFALENLCKKKGAKIAIVQKTYANDPYYITRNNTSTETKSIQDDDGHFHSYQVTTTTPYEVAVDRFLYSTYLFVKIPEEYRVNYVPGFSISDLSQEDINTYFQNTGVKIITVFNNTPAYLANLHSDDIILEINGKKIIDSTTFFDIQSKANNGDTWKIKVLSRGEEKNISLVIEK